MTQPQITSSETPRYRTVFGTYTANKTLARTSHGIYYFVGLLDIYFAAHGFANVMHGSPWLLHLLAGTIISVIALVVKLLQFERPVFGWRQLGISIVAVSLTFLFGFFGIYAQNGFARAVDAERVKAVDVVITYVTVARREIGEAQAKVDAEEASTVAAADAKLAADLALYSQRRVNAEYNRAASASSSSGRVEETYQIRETRANTEATNAKTAAHNKHKVATDHLVQASAHLNALVAFQDDVKTEVSIDAVGAPAVSSAVDDFMEASDFVALAEVARRANGLMQAVNGEYQAAAVEGAESLDPKTVKVQGDHIFVLALRDLWNVEPVAWICFLAAFLLVGLDIIVAFGMRFGE